MNRGESASPNRNRCSYVSEAPKVYRGKSWHPNRQCKRWAEIGTDRCWSHRRSS